MAETIQEIEIEIKETKETIKFTQAQLTAARCSLRGLHNRLETKLYEQKHK